MILSLAHCFVHDFGHFWVRSIRRSRVRRSMVTVERLARMSHVERRVTKSLAVAMLHNS